MGAQEASFIARLTWKLIRIFVLINSENTTCGHKRSHYMYVKLKKYLVSSLEATFRVQFTRNLVRIRYPTVCFVQSDLDKISDECTFWSPWVIY